VPVNGSTGTTGLWLLGDGPGSAWLLDAPLDPSMLLAGAASLFAVSFFFASAAGWKDRKPRYYVLVRR